MSVIQPHILSSATPSELLAYIVAYHAHPTTVLIGCSKTDFLSTLAHELDHPEPTPKRHILKKTLLQTAISRHIRIAYIPTVTHLRAYLSVFSADASSVDGPPSDERAEEGISKHKNTPLLLAYGFLELHRDGSEWSAQGIGVSTALLIEAAARCDFRAAIIEPRQEEDKTVFSQQVPLLNGAAQNDDGSWSGKTVTTETVLHRWFVDHDIQHLL